jgi:hypothetical protein
MSFIESTKTMLTLGFMSLPLMLIAYTFFLGFGLGNIGMAILFFGQIAAVPFATYLFQNLFAALKSTTG